MTVCRSPASYFSDAICRIWSFFASTALARVLRVFDTEFIPVSFHLCSMLSLSKWSLDDCLSFASLVFLGCYLSHLVILCQHSIGKGVERQRSLTVGIHNFFWKGYGTWHSVNGCDQAVGSYLRILDACIQRLFGIDAIVDSATSLLRTLISGFWMRAFRGSSG